MTQHDRKHNGAASPAEAASAHERTPSEGSGLSPRPEAPATPPPSGGLTAMSAVHAPVDEVAAAGPPGGVALDSVRDPREVTPRRRGSQGSASPIAVVEADAAEYLTSPPTGTGEFERVDGDGREVPGGAAAPEAHLGRPPRSPLGELWTVAWPTVLSMTSYTAMQFVDSLMVSRVGPIEFTAQSNGGMIVFIPLSFVMGILSLINTYVSQNLGSGTPEEGPKYVWSGLRIAFLTWLGLMVFALALPAIFGLTDHDPKLRELEIDYARILIFGAIFMLTTRTVNHFFYGMHQPKVVFVATVVGNIVNIVANYILIFGKLGLPALGLHGAALGTLIGSFVEMLIPLAIFLGPRLNRELHTRAAWRAGWKPVWQILRLGWPKGLTFCNEMLCWTIFMIFLVGEYFGTAHMTAGWIALKYMHLSFMPALGISFAVTAVVGRYIGAGQPDVASHRAWLGVGMACAFMGFCAIMFVIFRQPMAEIFVNVQIEQASPEEAERLRAMSAEIVSAATKILICAAVFQVFDAIAITLSGALTGAGDTVWPGIANIVVSWACTVGLGWLMCEMFPELQSLGPWIGAAAYIIVLGILYYFRWRGGYWRTIRLVEKKKPVAASDVA